MEWAEPLPIKHDFITNIRYSQSTDTYILIHDQPTVDIVQSHAVRTYLTHPQQATTLAFETPLYDVIAIQGCLLASNSNMPLRLYQMPQQAHAHLEWSSIADRLPNSEKYLAPIQLAQCGDTVVGGGKKFLSHYDLNKLTARRHKDMHKRLISSVELLNENQVVAGQFSGELTIVDLRQEEAAATTRPHVDSVTRIKRVGHSAHQFVTVARKDNYAYLWDARSMSTFLQLYQQPLYANQRTGLEISSDGQTVYLGGEDGKITAKDLRSSTQLFQIQTPSPQCVTSLCCGPTTMLAAVGSRCFPLADEPQRLEGSLLCCLTGGVSDWMV